MKGKLFEVVRVPLRLRDTNCLMVQYDVDPEGIIYPTEDRVEAAFKLTILNPGSSNLYGYTFALCRHHLAQFIQEVETHGSQALRGRGR